MTARFGRLFLIGFGAASLTLLALPLVPGVRHDLGPATISAKASLGAGRTVLVAPPLGTVSATTHDAPLALELAVTTVDVSRVEDELAAGSLREEGVAAIEDDLRSLARQLVIRLGAASIILAALFGAVLPHRRWSNFAAAITGSVGVTAALVVATMTSFDHRAFQEPKFTGALARAPEVLDAVGRGVSSFDSLGSRYDALASRISELLRLSADPDQNHVEDAVAILHISDIHSNPVGVEIAKRLARSFDVDAIVDTGDFTSFGEDIESLLVRLLNGVDVPYYFVPGNHDSPANRRAMDAAKSVDLLNKSVANVEGIEILGWADPTFTAGTGISTEEGNELREQEAVEVAMEVAATTPDVLAVHDARLAEESIGAVPLVLAGHTHQRELDEQDGTTILSVGSTGATGLGAFTIEADLPYEAQIIYLKDGAAIAVDYVKFFGLGAEFEVDREIIRLIGTDSESQ